jgi:hypothetical protein
MNEFREFDDHIGETGHKVGKIVLSVWRANERLRKAVLKNFPVGTAVSIKQLRDGRWDYSAGTIAAHCESLSWGAAVQSDDPSMPEFRRMKFGTNVFHFEWRSIELAAEVAPDGVNKRGDNRCT